MRPIVMRPIILAVSVLSAACGDQLSTAPTSPASAPTAQAQAQSAVQLPFQGSVTTADQGVVVPPNLLVDGTGEGNATHLGHFTVTYSAIAGLATATGTYTFTAANGDQLLTTFSGTAVTMGPGVFSFTEALAIVGGTGRLAGATGTFTLRRIGIVDFATGRSTSTGDFEGHITLKD
jgi:hypothetical protein